MYKKRKHSKSGFEKYCQKELSRVKKASKAGSRSKSAKAYQRCLTVKHNIRTGYKPKPKELK